ncbi:alpha/beta hydrolase [Algoriphagus sp. C2-6-M1]|uniref:alpha/beta hydrolase n=1 Tax=Algoriphagus persicinus TaxID=3108754 RepID=UPI002B3E87E4|nr:alpha/beta hydrolase [Algoriphagus sp. C2-6-M1]MEB2782315.1 alpha/beta hydrolase [Algoriphagus sp. C2-6-M1]
MLNKFFKFRFLVLLSSSIIFYSCNSDSEEPIPNPIAALDITNEAYGTDANNSMDIYLPEGRSKETTPLFIYIHGGGWITGDKSEIQAFRPIVENAFPGYAIISLNYSLLDLASGTGKFPEQENDIIAAINHILSKTEDWDVSQELILAGASAGGHLALLHSYKHPEIGNIKAVMALFPITDLTTFFDFNSNSQLLLSVMLNGNPVSQSGAYMESSPITYVSSTSIPTVLFHGAADEVVPISQSESLAAELEKNSVANYFEAIPGEVHGFQPITYLGVIQKAAQFIANEL